MEPYTKLAPGESSGDSAEKLKADGPRGDTSVASPFQDPLNGSLNENTSKGCSGLAQAALAQVSPKGGDHDS